MKIQLLAFCIYTLSCNIAYSQSPSEEALLRRLRKTSETISSLEAVLKKADEYSALVLFEAAKVAFKEKRLEDSAFLFYAAQLRYRFDLECFPPKGEGGNSPFQLYAVLSNNIGMEINPAVVAKPKVFAKVLSRVKEWVPKVAESYDPGYEYLHRKSEEFALNATKQSRTKFIKQIADQSSLLNDAEYFKAFKIVQSYNLSLDDKKPTTESYNNAITTIKRIEKHKGLNGIGETFTSEVSPASTNASERKSPLSHVNETTSNGQSTKESLTRSLYKATANGDISTLRSLVENKVDVNATGKTGNSALLASIFFEQKECFDFLLANGADPNQQSHSGDSPISIAANKESGNEYWLKALLKNGADPNLVNDKDDHEAAQAGFKNTTPIFNAIAAMNVNNVELLIDAGANIRWKDDRGVSLLAIAAEMHQFDIVLVLLKHGADCEAKTEDDRSVKEFLKNFKKESLPPKQKEFLLQAIEFIEKE